MEATIIEVLVKGGLSAIVLALLYYTWQKDKLYNKTLNNHLEHTHRSDIELTKALTKLDDSLSSNTKILDKLAEKIDSCPYKK